MRARRQSAGGREDFAEALPRDVRHGGLVRWRGRGYGWHHATLSAFAAPVAAGRALNLTPEQMVSAIGISASRTFCPGAVTAGKLTNMKNTVDPWAGRMGAESALLAREGFSGPEHIIDGKEGLFAVFGHVQYKGQPATFDGDGLRRSFAAILHGRRACRWNGDAAAV